MIMDKGPRGLLRLLQTAGFALLLLVCGPQVTAQATTTQATLVVLGDSISAAYGMDLEQGWVSLLEQKLSERDHTWEVVNASISGDTSGGGLQRLPSLLQRHNPAIVVLELGGNDGLRGYPIDKLRSNLTAMTKLSQDAGAAVLLLGMEIPPNFGRRYTGLFRESYPTVAEATGAAVSGFILEGIATVPGQMQGDGIHPTVAAQARLLANVWEHLEPMVIAQEAQSD